MHVIYRDPVHDFAFLRCDLAALKVRAQAPPAQAQPDCFWRCASAGGWRAARPLVTAGSCLRRAVSGSV